MAVLNILPPESFLKVLGFSLLNIVVICVSRSYYEPHFKFQHIFIFSRENWGLTKHV